jgi:hypothetical protein
MRPTNSISNRRGKVLMLTKERFWKKNLSFAQAVFMTYANFIIIVIKASDKKKTKGSIFIPRFVR